MNTYFKSFVALGIICLCATSQANETRWVTDNLSIMLRSGESSKHKILKSIVSGTKLSVVSENPETGYSYVKVNDKYEGFVLTRFLETGPASKQQLAVALQQIEMLSLSSEPAKLQLTEQRKKIVDLETKIVTLNAKNQTLSQELEHIKNISSDAISINEQYGLVLEKTRMLQNEVDLQRNEIERLSDSSNREWFINGALAVLLGVFIAVLLPRLKRPKGHSEWT